MEMIESLYTPQELAELWKFDESTIRRMFQDEPGVLKKSLPVLLKNRKRSPRVTLRIPVSVAKRVFDRLSR
jgi:hypothetical protein